MNKGTFYRLLYICLAIGAAFYMIEYKFTQNYILDLVIFFIGAQIVASMFKSELKRSERLEDLNKYSDINTVIAKYDAPDDMQNMGEFVKYTFKKEFNSFGLKYQKDIFTMKNNQLIKHERFWE